VVQADEQNYIMASYDDDVEMQDVEEEEEEVRAELAPETESDSESRHILECEIRTG
jgi:hypothetical protein